MFTVKLIYIFTDGSNNYVDTIRSAETLREARSIALFLIQDNFVRSGEGFVEISDEEGVVEKIDGTIF